MCVPGLQLRSSSSVKSIFSLLGKFPKIHFEKLQYVILVDAFSYCNTIIQFSDNIQALKFLEYISEFQSGFASSVTGIIEN